MKTAAYWHASDHGKVACVLCPHACVIPPGKTGICGVRENREGALVALTHLVASSSAVDPVEKKPLYHFFPGSSILSFGSFGCNLSCTCCQNYTISKEFPRGQLGRPNLSVARMNAMLDECGPGVSLLEFCGVAYTYNEPSVWIETILELAPVVRARGLKNVLVTNGFICQKPLADLLETVDALNIDLKGFDDEFYRRWCGGRLEPVLETIKSSAAKAHVELTTLVIPTLNDTPDHFSNLRDWVAGEVGPDTPVHLSRYHPMFRQTLPATPAATLERGRDILRQKLHYVYAGNVAERQDTRCAQCGALAITRSGYITQRTGLTDKGGCAKCGSRIAVGQA